MKDTEANKALKVSSNAAHVIAGFRYQALQSVAALMGLRGDEELLLEVSEDFTIVAEDGVTDVQVKNSQAAKGPRPFSLQSPEIASVLQRYWEGSGQGTLDRRLVFLARAGAAVERGYGFPGGLPGLAYWRAAAMDADTQPLRAALSDILSETSLGRWLASGPDDAELRSRLLRRVQWELESLSAEQLFTQLRDQIGELLHARNLPVIAASQAVRSLTDLAFETASKPQAQDRRLTRVDLVRTMDECAAALLLGQHIAAVAQGAERLGQGLLVSELEGLSPSIAQRAETIGGLLSQTTGQPLIWIHGANGVGKSTLARLVGQRLGGRWLELDLRPVQKDSSGSLAAWRELSRMIVLAAPPDGVIIDDVDDEAANALRSRISSLARMFGSRGARIIVTSHHEPSPAFLLECGTAASASIHASYFTEEDITELVSAAPAPADDMIRPWSAFIRLSTGGGHPLLAAAKISSLRARGWPNTALFEDILGEPGEAVRLSRDEARRTLLRDLAELDQARSLDAGSLLRRIGCVFDRVEDGLIRKLALAAPPLRNGGDALAVLRGTWLEAMPGGDLRVSPLLTDIVSDVALDDLREWRSVAAEYWLSKRILDERTLPLCFWNAFWGQHSGVLSLLCTVVQTTPKERLRGAAALLSPITALVTDRSLFPSNPAVAVQLRLLQFEVADALEEGALAGTIARRLIEEINCIEHADLRAMLVHVAASKFLMAEFAEITPADRISYAFALRAAEPKVLELSDDHLPDPATLLPSQFKPGMDVADFLFSTIPRHITNSSDELEAFRALDAISADDRNGFLEAMSAIYEGHAVFVHSGWSRDQLEEHDMGVALQYYDRIELIADGWSRPDISVEVACARSTILDEGLGHFAEAICVVDEAVSTYGEIPSLVRQKSKVLGHAGRDAEALDLLLQIEEEVGNGSPFDRSLALRDGAMSAAKSGRFDDGLRLLDKALASLAQVLEREPLAAALLVEKSLLLWCAGRRPDAVLAAADALDAVEAFLPSSSRQAERSHQFARAIVGLFFSELDDERADGTRPISFGQASSLESNTATLLGVDLKPLEDNWRVLAVVEAAIEADVGIDARSMKKQVGPLMGSTELLLRQKRYEHALRSQNIAEALRAGATVLAVARALQNVQRDGDQLPRVAVLDLMSLDPQALRDDAPLREMIQCLSLDVILYRKIVAGEALDCGFLDELRRSSEMVFGPDPDLVSVVDAVYRDVRAGPADPMSVIYASAVKISDLAIVCDPALRFYRDMMVVSHIATSFARRALAAAAVNKIVAGWRYVLGHQRFMLRNPAIHAPAMEAAIEKMKVPALGNVAALLLAAAPAVGHRYAEGWKEWLRGIASSELSAVQEN